MDVGVQGTGCGYTREEPWGRREGSAGRHARGEVEGPRMRPESVA